MAYDRFVENRTSTTQKPPLTREELVAETRAILEKMDAAETTIRAAAAQALAEETKSKNKTGIKLNLTGKTAGADYIDEDHSITALLRDFSYKPAVSTATRLTAQETAILNAQSNSQVQDRINRMDALEKDLRKQIGEATTEKRKTVLRGLVDKISVLVEEILPQLQKLAANGAQTLTAAQAQELLEQTIPSAATAAPSAKAEAPASASIAAAFAAEAEAEAEAAKKTTAKSGSLLGLFKKNAVAIFGALLAVGSLGAGVGYANSKNWNMNEMRKDAAATVDVLSAKTTDEFQKLMAHIPAATPPAHVQQAPAQAAPASTSAAPVVTVQAQPQIVTAQQVMDDFNATHDKHALFATVAMQLTQNLDAQSQLPQFVKNMSDEEVFRLSQVLRDAAAAEVNTGDLQKGRLEQIVAFDFAVAAHEAGKVIPAPAAGINPADLPDFAVYSETVSKQLLKDGYMIAIYGTSLPADGSVINMPAGTLPADPTRAIEAVKVLAKTDFDKNRDLVAFANLVARQASADGDGSAVKLEGASVIMGGSKITFDTNMMNRHIDTSAFNPAKQVANSNDGDCVRTCSIEAHMQQEKLKLGL